MSERERGGRQKENESEMAKIDCVLEGKGKINRATERVKKLPIKVKG